MAYYDYNLLKLIMFCRSRVPSFRGSTACCCKRHQGHADLFSRARTLVCVSECLVSKVSIVVSDVQPDEGMVDRMHKSVSDCGWSSVMCLLCLGPRCL